MENDLYGIRDKENKYWIITEMKIDIKGMNVRSEFVSEGTIPKNSYFCDKAFVKKVLEVLNFDGDFFEIFKLSEEECMRGIKEKNENP